MARYIFVDRDGTINIERPNYVQRWEQFEFIPGALEALRLLKENDFQVFVITNQSCIARGIVDEPTVIDVHCRMCDAVCDAGGEIRKAYYCPHAPEVAECDCRKPAVGLYEQAAKDFDFDPSQAWGVGDDARDLKPCRALGGQIVLVKTGKSVAYEKGFWDIEPDYVADDLLAAVKLIVGIENTGG